LITLSNFAASICHIGRIGHRDQQHIVSLYAVKTPYTSYIRTYAFIHHLLRQLAATYK